MMWHGGASYAVPSAGDAEEFDTVSEMLGEFEARAEGWHRRFPVVSRVPPDDGGPEAWVFFTDPKEMYDVYPHRLLYFGPRGGLRYEVAG